MQMVGRNTATTTAKAEQQQTMLNFRAIFAQQDHYCADGFALQIVSQKNLRHDHMYFEQHSLPPACFPLFDLGLLGVLSLSFSIIMLYSVTRMMANTLRAAFLTCRYYVDAV